MSAAHHGRAQTPLAAHTPTRAPMLSAAPPETRKAEPLDCFPAELLYRKGLTLLDLRLYELLRRLDVHGHGTVQVSHRRLAQMREMNPQNLGRCLRRLKKAGVIEVVYGGRFAPGPAAGDANVYRLLVIHRHGERWSEKTPDGGPKRPPSRWSQKRAISSPYGRTGAPTRVDGSSSACPHPYPCACAECLAWIEDRHG